MGDLLKAVNEWIDRMVERLLVCIIMWIRGGPDKPWSEEE